jgi:D-sedoheptulose 7-phosphate isomerase
VTHADTIRKELEAHELALRETVARSSAFVTDAVAAVVRCFQGGNKLLFCGNGGSAADSQHIAAEFINRFNYDRAPLPAIALTVDTSVLTCVANDSAYENVFSRQVEALAKPGDLLVAISTSGRSPTVLRALDVARGKGVVTVGLTGESGRESMGSRCDLCLAAASRETARIQEVHEFVLHLVAGMVERELFPRPDEPRQ